MSGFESFSLAMVLWVIMVLALAGFIQGALGFGFLFVATPLIAIVSDMHTAVVTILLPMLATVVVTPAISGPLRPVLARFWMMPLYAILGSFAGTWLFVAAPEAPYSFLLALIIVGSLNLDRVTRRLAAGAAARARV